MTGWSDRPGRGHVVDWRAGPGETDSLIKAVGLNV
jgi:hypothetical protein